MAITILFLVFFYPIGAILILSFNEKIANMAKDCIDLPLILALLNFATAKKDRNLSIKRYSFPELNSIDIITLMAVLFLFRHGQTTDNKEDKFSGWANPDLTTEGIQEANIIAQKLKLEKVTRAYSSDLIRSVHTLEIVLKYHLSVKPIIDKRLRERNYGLLTGKLKKEIEKEDPKDYILWHRSYNIAPPQGESIKDVEKRVMPFIKNILKKLNKNDILLLSAHGNSMRPIRRFFEHMTIQQMCSFEHTPAKIYRYNI